MVRTVKKPEERRMEIILAAAQLFQEKSYEQTSMQDVMNLLGIAKGTIYHYFKSKDELLEAVTEFIIDADVKKREELLADMQGNALEKLTMMITINSAADEHEGILEQLHQPGNLALHTKLLAQAIIKQAPLYAGIIEQGVAEGIFHCDNPLESAEFVLTAIQFLTDTGISPWTPEDIQRRILAVPAILEAQFGAEKGSFQFFVENL